MYAKNTLQYLEQRIDLLPEVTAESSSQSIAGRWSETSSTYPGAKSRAELQDGHLSNSTNDGPELSRDKLHLLLIIAWHNLAMAQLRCSLPKEEAKARQSLQTAVSLATAHLGPTHPTTVSIHDSALSLWGLGSRDGNSNMDHSSYKFGNDAEEGDAQVHGISNVEAPRSVSPSLIRRSTICRALEHDDNDDI
mmetsp:Transcript_115281/g.200686  ORF Transcript_115281/g.200686 Transcript_115281/m.200686 type:complete len:193 (-) Transcript_115281:1232-1810(-)